MTEFSEALRTQVLYMKFRRFLGYNDYVRADSGQKKKLGAVYLFGQTFRYTDGRAFLSSLREIFLQDLYYFEADRRVPLIIDAGANIGLSVLYFKRMHPDARIIAFEPDPSIFEILSANIGGMAELRNSAVWTDNTELSFHAEGTLGGSSEVRIAENAPTIVVTAEDLKPYLDCPVDFLKMDIEGAESTVLFDIEPLLKNIRMLFLEYHSIVGQKQRLADILKILQNAGFRCIINHALGPGRPFFTKLQSGYDTQLNVACVRD